MHEQIRQVIDNIAQFATDLNSVRNELLLEGEFDIYEELPEAIHNLANELINHHRQLREVVELSEVVGEVEEEVTFKVAMMDEDDSGFDVIEAIRNDERSWTQLAKDAGIKRETLKRFMLGTVKPHTKTLRGIEKALWLEEGSLDE